MHAAADRPEFAPPPQPGLLRGFALAVLAHVLLVLALMHGLHWQRDSETAAVEAELWSAVPREAAPREEPVPPPPPPQPVVKAPPQPDPETLRQAQIAVEREKKQRELEKEKQHQAQLEREQKRKLEAEKKQEQQKLAADAKRKDDEKKRKQQEQEARDTKVRDQIRKDAIARNLAMAGTGAPSSTGTAAQSSGPSKSWAGKVIARVRPNIVYTDVVTGNPEAVVEVRLAPDGTIVGRRLKKPSGNTSWDEAVLRALDKTEVLPRDPETGRVPGGADLVFRPKG